LAIHIEKTIRYKSLIDHRRPFQIPMAAERLSDYDSDKY